MWIIFRVIHPSIKRAYGSCVTKIEELLAQAQ
jgi:hypothetical protein